LKSCLKMLLVAGAFAVSLAAFQDDALADTQLASWYGPGFEGNITASGDVFEPYTEYTAASPYLPFGTKLLVTYESETVGPTRVAGTWIFPRLPPRTSGLSTPASTTLTSRSSTN
jgi:rare lipoprotein A